MTHKIIAQVLNRAEQAKSDSDFTYFFDLLLAAEAIAKTIILNMLAAVGDDKDRNRYRIEHSLVRADGLGDWGRSLDDILTGTASQYLLAEARQEQSELTKACRNGEWQYHAVSSLKKCLQELDIDAEELPVKTDMRRWFRLLSTLRNKTKGHGATKSGTIAGPAAHLKASLDIIVENLEVLRRPCAFLHRNISGKYRISSIAGNDNCFDELRKNTNYSYQNGVYIHWGIPKLIPLIESDPDLTDFYFANGSFSGKKFELLSYSTNNKRNGDAASFSTPPGLLPSSETGGHGELLVKVNCLSNAPDLIADYIARLELESELLKLLLDDKRPIVTLRGRGGIGKTSLALRVLELVYQETRYDTIVWLSARDVDLHLSGPKPVRPNIFGPLDVGRLYADLVLSPVNATALTGIKAQAYLEKHLQQTDSGVCLFVFDNFETTQNPVEMFTWLDTYIRLPNKVLITTRLRDFKGDYPVDVQGMKYEEALSLINQFSSTLGISSKLSQDYIEELIRKSAGHPYVIKILLGEVARTGRENSIPQLLAGSEDILTALFERTYSALSPCAQQGFLTLSAWSSSVPRLALEAVLLRSTQEPEEVEVGVESLLNYSLAEAHLAPADNQEYLSLPLVASVFGKKKLNISPHKASIMSDVQLLQMLGPSRRDDVHLGLAKGLEKFVAAIAERIERGESYDKYEPIVEMICRSYNPGWLVLARWYIELGTNDSLLKAQTVLRRFLEEDSLGSKAAEAWRSLAFVCHKLGDTHGEVHAFVERAQLSDVSFYDVSSTAHRLSQSFREAGEDDDRYEKSSLANRLLTVMALRKKEADADDFSRMAWLAIHLNQEAVAQDYIKAGLALDFENYHCQKLSARLGLSQ
jgi:hypothetical protein